MFSQWPLPWSEHITTVRCLNWGRTRTQCHWSILRMKEILNPPPNIFSSISSLFSEYLGCGYLDSFTQFCLPYYISDQREQKTQVLSTSGKSGVWGGKVYVCVCAYACTHVYTEKEYHLRNGSWNHKGVELNSHLTTPGTICVILGKPLDFSKHPFFMSKLRRIFPTLYGCVEIV